MRERLAQLARARVAGVPVPVLFLVLVLVAAVIIHRRRVKAASPQDASNLDATSSVGAMANGGYAGQDYSFPVPAGSGDSVDTTGDPIGGVTNPAAGGTTVTGGTTPSPTLPGKATPPKKSPAKVSHPAGHHPVPKPAPKAVHKAAAPAKHTTVHKAPVATTHVPAPRPKPAAKTAPAKRKSRLPKINARGGVGNKPYGPPLPGGKGAAAAAGVTGFGRGKPKPMKPAPKKPVPKKPSHRRAPVTRGRGPARAVLS